MADLSSKQLQILEYLKQEVRDKGYPPSVREICEAIGLKSTSTVHGHLSRLEKKGLIRRDPTKPRAIEILDESFEDEYIEHRTQELIDVPIIGTITAGAPILAVENIEDTFPIPARYAAGGTNFMLRVRGESMIEAGIMDGDLILVQQTQNANNGEIVVAMIDGFESEATVKTFYRENGHIRLQPENHTMSPIIVQDVKIMGKVKGVFRYFA